MIAALFRLVRDLTRTVTRPGRRAVKAYRLRRVARQSARVDEHIRELAEYAELATARIKAERLHSVQLEEKFQRIERGLA